MEIKYASIWKRAGAWIIDSIVFYWMYLILNQAIVFFFGNINYTVEQILTIICFIAFELVQLIAFKGRTIGKMCENLRIVDINTYEPPTKTSTYIKRLAACIIVIEVIGMLNSWLSFIYIIVSMYIANKSPVLQSLWDKFAETTVISEGK